MALSHFDERWPQLVSSASVMGRLCSARQVKSASSALVRRNPESRACWRSEFICDMLEKALLFSRIGWRVGADLGVGGGHGDTAAWSAFDEALHNEEGFVHFLQGRRVFTDGDGE